jgi:hypothetical protein
MAGNRDSRLVGWLRSGRAAHAGLVAAGVVAAAILAIGAVTVEDEPGTGADRGGQGDPHVQHDRL